MDIDKSSLAYRLLVPIFAVISVVSIALLVLISHVTNDIIDDYYRSTLAGYADESKSFLDSAMVELATAQLLDDRRAVEAKQREMLKALDLNWRAHAVNGMVVGPDNRVLFSTLSPEQDKQVASRSVHHLFTIEQNEHLLRGLGIWFPAWDWKIYLVTMSDPGLAVRREIRFLVPLVATGTLLMVAALLLILQKRLRGPVTSMVTDLHAERAISPTGVSELDQIGRAINAALGRVKERTEAVLQKEERIQLLLDSTAEGIYGVDINGICTFSNAACLALLGYERGEEMLGRNVHNLIHHSLADGRSYPEQECPIYYAFRSRSEVHRDTEVFWRLDGISFPVEYWSYPIVKDGEIVGAVVTFVDISERKKAEAALREERNKFEAIIAAIGDGISMQDRTYRVLYQNEVHRGMAGDHVGDLCYEAYENRKERCEGCSIAQAFEDGRVHTSERVLHRDGEKRFFEMTASPLRDASGAIIAGIELVRDVTARRRTESQLMQAQKMEAVGRLAGGIAHDFNNVLSAVVGYASLVKKHVAEGSQPYFYTGQVLQAAQRATALTRQILAFSRKQVLEARLVSINEIVRGMEPFMTRVLGEDIEVRTVLAGQDMTVLADSGQIEQVLMNLATNARDAMPQGGALIIKTECVSVDPAAADLHELQKGASYALLSVSDTGSGMDERTKTQIFEPFFTTKELGLGTGLGLAIVYGIIKQHKGHIGVYSEPGKGTTFRIYLPLAGGQAEIGTDEPVKEVRGGTETILVAEDNAEVAGAVKHSLEESGYRVIEARDGEEAVRKFREHAAELKLCLFDVIMPKKNGKDAFAEIAALRDDVKVIFMSGYTADVIEAKDLLQKNTVFMSKPLIPHKLLALVREVLDRR
jgi:two-component system NtrC family sensor kinase